MLWDTTTGERVANLRVTDRGVVSVAFSPDGKFLAGRDYMRDDHRALSEVVLWDVATRRELRRIGGHGGWIYALAFSPDGKVLSTSGSNQAVQFWDVANGREIRRIDGAAVGRCARLLAEWPDAGDGRRRSHSHVVGSRG